MITGVMEEIERAELIDLERYICDVKGDSTQPLLLFICGIHGNEPMSVFAMKQVMEYITNESHIYIDGNFFVSGFYAFRIIIGGSLKSVGKFIVI